MAWEHELETAKRLAVKAGEQALRMRREGLRPEGKPDRSLVTAADRACEKLIAEALAEEFPEDGLLAEEGGLRHSRSGRRWIVDPVDGTLDYVRSIPLWSVLIALEDQEGVAVGVCYLPEPGEMYWAARGGGAWRNGQRLRVSQVSDPADAVLCVNALHKVDGAPWGARVISLMSRFRAVRCLGGCQDAMLVASGRAEAWIEPQACEWDLAALKIIAEEAGAVFFNFDGGSNIYGGNCVICVPALAPVVREALAIP